MIARLDNAIRAVCPIEGIADPGRGPSGIIIQFLATATPQQKAAAQAVLDSFDWSEEAQIAWQQTLLPQRQRELSEAAATALAENAAFLAMPSPSPAQTLAQVKRLTIQNSLFIRRLLEN